MDENNNLEQNTEASEAPSAPVSVPTSGLNNDSKMYALLGILLGLIGYIVVISTKKDDVYAMFYAKQGLVLWIIGFIGYLILIPLRFIPMGWIVSWILSTILWLGLIAILIIGLINSQSGEMKDTLLIGPIARKF